eukprot:9000259-Alexandrium_andersonii.AAC.1
MDRGALNRVYVRASSASAQFKPTQKRPCAREAIHVAEVEAVPCYCCAGGQPRFSWCWARSELSLSS